jgi:hypothetical protein
VGIANLIWGAARLGLSPSPQVGRLLLWQAQRTFSGMDLQLLSSCVWGVAKLGLKPGLHWLHRMGRRVSGWLLLLLLPPLLLLLLLGRVLLAGCVKNACAWLCRCWVFWNSVMPAAAYLQLLSNCAWGMARLGLKPRLHWLHRMGRRVSAGMFGTGRMFSAVVRACGLWEFVWRKQRCLNVLWVWLYLPCADSSRCVTCPVFLLFFCVQVRHLAPSSITPSLASSLLLSFGALHYCPRVWLGRFLHTLHPHLPAFTPRDIANTYTAFERMLYVPKDDWLFDFQMEARMALPKCGAQELLSIARALSVLSNNVAAYRVEPDFLAALVARCGAIAAAQFSPADCANLAQSLVYLKAAPGTGLLAGLAAAFNARVGDASDDDVVGMLWAIGAFWRSSSECLWLRQHPELVRELISRAGAAMGRLGPLQLKRMVAAVAAMSLNPGQAWLAAHEAAVVAQLPEMYAASLEQVLWCYRGLGYSASQGQLLQEALAVQQEALRRQQQQQQQAAAVQEAEQRREWQR